MAATGDKAWFEMLAQLKTELLKNENYAEVMPLLDEGFSNGGLIKSTDLTARAQFQKDSRNLPGMEKTVGHPETNYSANCDTYETASLWNMIQHLNDRHRWTRDKIADWIEEFDDVPAFAVSAKEKE